MAATVAASGRVASIDLGELLNVLGVENERRRHRPRQVVIELDLAELAHAEFAAGFGLFLAGGEVAVDGRRCIAKVDRIPDLLRAALRAATAHAART